MEHSACFIGHRKIEMSDELVFSIDETMEKLATEGICNFIFGDHSEFNELCLKEAAKLQKRYPEIRRIRFRKDYPELDSYSERFFLTDCEENIYPKGEAPFGRGSYIMRNRAMITESEVCVFYYNKDYSLQKPASSAKSRSGTDIAYRFALKSGKRIINLYEIVEHK